MAEHWKVAKNWYLQTGKCQNGSSMFYRGATIYSYGRHFPIAELFTTPNGEHVVLFNNNTASGTTSEHQGIVRGSIKRKSLIVKMNLGRFNPEMDWQDIVSSLPGLAGKWQRARQGKPYIEAEIKEVIKTGNRLSKLFNLNKPQIRKPRKIESLLT